MKRIRIPADIQYENMEGLMRDHSFQRFLKTAVEMNEKYGTGRANIRRGLALSSLIEEQCIGDEFLLENADYDEIGDSIDAGKWIPKIAFQLEPFITAFEKAETFVVKKIPKEEKAVEPKAIEDKGKAEDAPKA